MDVTNSCGYATAVCNHPPLELDHTPLLLAIAGSYVPIHICTRHLMAGDWDQWGCGYDWHRGGVVQEPAVLAGNNAAVTDDGTAARFGDHGIYSADEAHDRSALAGEVFAKAVVEGSLSTMLLHGHRGRVGQGM